MSITPRTTWTEADDYADRRYQIIKQLEESGRVSLTAYLDTHIPAIPTIGLGFNISANTEAVMVGLGVDSPKSALELPYFNRVVAIVNGSYASNAALQAALDKVMSDRAADPEITGTKRSTFTFANETEVKSVFNSIADGYDKKIVNWEKQYGISPSTATIPSLLLSPELAVLFSLSYNTTSGGTSLLGRGLANAILAGNRAEAWYEIRYNSNLALQTGIAKRRYIESEIFGLYSDAGPVSPADAKLVYGMLSAHRTNILKQEALFGLTPDGTRGTQLAFGKTGLELAISDGATISGTLDDGKVDSLSNNLLPARDAFITWANTQLPTGAAPLVASDWNPAAIYFRGPDMGGNVLDANVDNGKGNTLDKNLLVGGDRSDYLRGGTGNDVLIGGGSDDILEGGVGDNTLYGGDGNDTYIIDLRDGVQHDRIIDSDGKGRIVVIKANGEVINTQVLQKPGTAEAWIDKDGQATITHNSPWKITLSDGSVIELGDNFDPLGFGISLQDKPDDTTTSSSGDFLKKIDPAHPTSYLTSNGNYVDGGVQVNANDLITGTAAADLLKGLGGNDGLSGGVGDDVIEGGDGDDLLLGALGADSLSGGAGKDFIFGSGQGSFSYPTSIDAAAPVALGPEYTRGFSWVTYDAGIDANGIRNYQILGGLGSNVANDKGNVIEGGAGDDWIRAGSGADVVHGGDDKDDIDGLAGNDVLFGDAGDDISSDGVEGLSILLSFQAWSTARRHSDRRFVPVNDEVIEYGEAA